MCAQTKRYEQGVVEIVNDQEKLKAAFSRYDGYDEVELSADLGSALGNIGFSEQKQLRCGTQVILSTAKCKCSINTTDGVDLLAGS